MLSLIERELRGGGARRKIHVPGNGCLFIISPHSGFTPRNLTRRHNRFDLRSCLELDTEYLSANEYGAIHDGAAFCFASSPQLPPPQQPAIASFRTTSVSLCWLHWNSMQARSLKMQRRSCPLGRLEQLKCPYQWSSPLRLSSPTVSRCRTK